MITIWKVKSLTDIPNILTMLRVVAVPFFVFFTLISGFEDYSVAFIIFIVASLTDFFDGYLARKWNVVSSFGKLMDPLADKLLVFSALIFLLKEGLVPYWSVVVIVGREFAVSGLRSLAAERGLIIAAGISGKIKTVFQMLAIISFFMVLNTSLVFFRQAAPVLYYIALLLTVYSGVEYFWKTGALFHEK